MSSRNRMILLGAGISVGAVVGLVLVASPFGETDAAGGSHGEPVSTVGAAPPALARAGYGPALERLDARVRVKSARAVRMGNSWMAREELALAHLDRARLTGRVEDYLLAQEALEEAFELAPEGVGPRLSRAFLNVTLHRLDRVEADLKAVESQVRLLDDESRADIYALRGDVLFQSGDYGRSREAFERSDRLAPTPSSAYRLAQLHWKIGDFHEAERYLSLAEDRLSEQTGHYASWLYLQQGLLELDRGRLGEAMGHYRRADEAFPGWWLVEEHIAEVDLLEGRTDEAIEAYRELVRRTENPELMGALADALEVSDPGEAARLREWARREHERRIARLPEASYGHALEHFLQSGQPERAIELAEANHRLRPGGEASLKLVQAYALAGRLEDARRLTARLLETPYRTAEVHATAAQVWRAAGDASRAELHRTRALAMNPGAMEGVSWMRL